MIEKLIKTYAKELIFMPGGGIKKENLKEILSRTGAREFHASARSLKKSPMIYKNEKCQMGSDSSEYTIQVTSEEKVRELVSIFSLLK